MAVGAVTGTVTTNFNFSEKVTSGISAASGITAPLAITQTTSSYTTTGTGSGQANLCFNEQVTFVASTPQTFNMQTWLDPFGNVLNFVRVREFVIQVFSTTAGFNIELYSAASDGVAFLPPIANFIPIYAGGMYIFRDPISTGAGNGALITSTTCNFTINPGANAVVVNILAAGGTAV
jgi:hypothetical protein